MNTEIMGEILFHRESWLTILLSELFSSSHGKMPPLLWVRHGWYSNPSSVNSNNIVLTLESGSQHWRVLIGIDCGELIVILFFFFWHPEWRSPLWASFHSTSWKGKDKVLNWTGVGPHWPALAPISCRPWASICGGREYMGNLCTSFSIFL